ncbi:hypothetical protein Ae201684P_010404 [Aphanomyces euteiches]|nr:hypothetical protein Ae201684P_010404 [Aphanomyces euteiches]KAH9154963.1 hypothetical protein AeRB84_003029 [Aphanomyces euteiches]
MIEETLTLQAAVVASRRLIPYAAVASSILFAVAPLHDIRRIRQSRNTLSLPFLPFFLYVVQSMMFLLYALATSNALLMFTTSLGSILGTFYVWSYYKHMNDKTSARKWFLGGGGLLFMLGVIATAFDAQDAALWIGIPGNAVMVMTAVSPLAKASHIVRTQDASSLPVGMSVMNAVAGGFWTIYGVLLDDILVTFPNAVSTIVGLIQVALILRFARPSTSTSSKRSHIV